MEQQEADRGVREKQESLDITKAVLFGAALSVPFWLVVAGVWHLIAVFS